MTCSFLFDQGSFRGEAIIRNVSRRVNFLHFERDRARNDNALNEDGLHHRVVINGVSFVVVEDNNLNFVEGPANALILIRDRLSNSERGNGLSMVIGPQAKLIYLLRSTGLINVVDVDPSVPRDANL